MPIYEQSYRKYEARGALRSVRFWPITREALRLLLARKLFAMMMLATWIPLLGFVIYVFGITQLPEISRLAPLGGPMFAVFLSVQSWLALFPAIFGGSGLVANDLRSGAILVYLSRPLTRRDYVLGKLAVILLLTLSVTLLPGLLLYALAASLAPGVLFNWEHAWIAPAVALYSVVAAVFLSLVALGLSALSRSARVAGLAFFALMAALGPIAQIVRSIGNWPAVSLLSLMDDLTTLANTLFGVEGRFHTLPWPYPALTLAAVAAASLFVLRTRVRAVEIVQ